MGRYKNAINCNVTVILEALVSTVERGGNIHCREYVAALGDDGFLSDLTIFSGDIPVAMFCSKGVDERGLSAVVEEVEGILCDCGWER